MSQDFPDIEATDFVGASRANILSRDAAVKSNFSGTAYPTTDLIVGMFCYRTDLQKLYILESTGPSVWREVTFAANLGTAAAATIGTSGDTVPKNNTANTWAALQTYSAGLAVGATSVSGTSGALTMDTDVRLNALVTKTINFLIAGASKMTIATDGGLSMAGATGGSKGSGTINATALYFNGTVLGTAALVDTGTGAGNVPLNSQLGSASLKNTGTSGANVPLLSTANTWSAPQRGAITALVDGATVTPDFGVSANFSLTIAGNRALANPTNQVAGQSGIIVVRQDATGGRTLTLGSNWLISGNDELSTAANSIDVISYYVAAAGEIITTINKGFA